MKKHSNNPLERIEAELQEVDERTEILSDQVADLSRKIDQILGILTQEPVAQSATLQIHDSEGNILMPATLAVGATATAVFTEWSGLNGTGAKLPPVGAVSFASSDATIATVDPASGLVTAVGPGTATITGTDAGNGLTASDVVSDTPLVAQSATLVVTAN